MDGGTPTRVSGQGLHLAVAHVSQKWDSTHNTSTGEKVTKGELIRGSFRISHVLWFCPDFFFMLFFADKNKETHKQLMEENMKRSLHSFTETYVYLYTTMYSKYVIAYTNA